MKLNKSSIENNAIATPTQRNIFSRLSISSLTNFSWDDKGVERVKNESSFATAFSSFMSAFRAASSGKGITKKLYFASAGWTYAVSSTE